MLIITNTARNHLAIDDLLGRLTTVVIDDNSTTERKFLQESLAPNNPVPDAPILIIRDIGDLIEGQSNHSEAIWQVWELIMDEVDQDHWIDAGGDVGTVSWFADTLIILTTPQNHLAIDELLAKLREEQSNAPR